MRIAINSGWITGDGSPVYGAELYPDDEDEKTLLGSLMGEPLHVRTLELDSIDAQGVVGKAEFGAKAQVRKGTAE